jgi:L-fucose isomerase-like protein
VPDLSGLAYRMVGSFRRIELPIRLLTSEFGTVSMWDWEIRDHLRRRGVATIAPMSLQECLDVCRTLATKERLRRSTMLAYQDDLGAGMQADIVKRFYWWEDESVADLESAFDVRVERRSVRALAARAAAVPDARVEEAWSRWSASVPIIGLGDPGWADALRLYLALGDELDETGDVIAAGINCLNESATFPTTPCLAWNLLFEERGLMWGCEADLTPMITKTLLHASLGVPVMMTNLYRFLMGQAVLKHERIPFFPSVPEEPENHLLVAHCGFLGVVPQSFATQWTLRPRLLEIVDPNASAIDARIAEGATTIAKITSDMGTMTVSPAVLTSYAEYQNSDCLNGAVLRVANGHRFVEQLPTHHVILATGDLTRRIELMCSVLGMEVLTN